MTTKKTKAPDVDTETALQVVGLAHADLKTEAERLVHLAGTLTTAELGAVFRSKAARLDEYRTGQLIALLVHRGVRP